VKPAGWTKFVVVGAALVLLGQALGGVTRASGEEARPAVGDTEVLTRIPYPGQPLGLLLDGDTVWVSGGGVMQPEVDQWAVWAYDRRTGREKAADSFTVAAPAPAIAMGLAGMARDDRGRLYVVDMNGRILRTTARGSRTVEVYATVPTQGPGAADVPWPAGVSMPVDIAFDPAGNAYVADVNIPAIWRVPPGGGEAQPWFVDTRLLGVPIGTTAVRMAPSGRDLYFAMCLSSSPHHPTEGVIYRMPIDAPTAAAVTEVFRSPTSCPHALAFGTSGKLYASLTLANQVVVLWPDGTEERRFPSKEENARQEVPYQAPHWIALDGDGWLLVANAAHLAVHNPKNQAILKAFVDDTAAPLPEPSLP
jgi:sugar lactone lactonase YvrE